ncbi:MAG: glycosyltransferase family 39 protein [Lachnospiraceae bacterium]|nr:glycosyltransferase family 39 protein [Lachnospiraceae bacterium]
MKKAEEIFEKYNYIFLIPLLILYLYTRFQYLGEICYYIHADELEAAYEAMSLAHYRTFGPFHNDLLVILGAATMMLKGGLFSLKLFRLLSVLAGLFGTAFSYMCVLELTGKKKYAFLEAVVVITLPIYFISQRAGVGEYLFLEIVPAAYYFLLKAAGSSKRLYYILSGILWGLIILTGSSAYFIVPVFLTASLIYLIRSKKTSLIDAAALIIPVLIFVPVLFVLGHESMNLGFGNILANIKNFKAVIWDDLHPFNVSSTFGTVFIFSIPLMAVGAVISVADTVSSVKRKEYSFGIILWIYILTVIISDLLTKDADLQTGCSLFFAVSLLLAEGMIYISKNLKWTFIIEIAVYLICFRIFTYYYFENFNSEVNNSTDHEMGIVVDKSVGEAVKAALRLIPGKEIAVISDDFEGRNLMIALFGDASPEDCRNFMDLDEYSFGNIRVVNEYTEDDSIYVINQAEHQDIIDSLISAGWGCVYLKEYTVCYRQ